MLPSIVKKKKDTKEARQEGYTFHKYVMCLVVPLKSQCDVFKQKVPMFIKLSDMQKQNQQQKDLLDRRQTKRTMYLLCRLES